MSDRLVHLTQLHAKALRLGEWGPYRRCAVEIAAGLPFPYRLVRVTPGHMSTNIGVVHIVAAEDVALGKLRRLSGDALCRPRWRFAGGLGDLVAPEEGATCYTCLSIAETHSTIARQAS